MKDRAVGDGNNTVFDGDVGRGKDGPRTASHDGRRHQLGLDDAVSGLEPDKETILREAVEAVKAAVRWNVSAAYETTIEAILASEADGKVQALHADMRTDVEGLRSIVEKADSDARKGRTPRRPVPIAALVPATDNQTTTVWMFPKSQGWVWARHLAGGKVVDGDETHPFCFGIRIQIPLGRVLLFRQDLVHAGDTFAADNVRIYLSMLPRGLKQPEDETQLVWELVGGRDVEARKEIVKKILPFPR
ncbi:hypothetical protein DFJ74DRAFT_677118 [Hyaloraphidium curvatum]|nr:hypothetical protein DFJ74DRAFT_677118 [Hyaloraphidium curvatum]